MATTKPKQTESSVQQPEPHVPRTSWPEPPSNFGTLSPGAQAAILKMQRARAYAPNLAIMEIKGVRTLNLNPAVAVYKTEALEYLNSLEG